MTMMAEDSMEIYSEHPIYEDIEVDIQDEDYAIGGVYDGSLEDIQQSPNPGNDDLMIDDNGGDDAASYIMDDAADEAEASHNDEPAGMSLGDDGQVTHIISQDDLQPHGVAIYDFAASTSADGMSHNEAARYHGLGGSDDHFHAADTEGTDSIDLGEFQEDSSREDGVQIIELNAFKDNGSDAPQGETAASNNGQGVESEENLADTAIAEEDDGEAGEVDWGFLDTDEQAAHDGIPEASASAQHHTEIGEVATSVKLPSNPSSVKAAEQTHEDAPASAGFSNEAPNQDNYAHSIEHDPRLSVNETNMKILDLYASPRVQEVRVTYRNMDYSLFSTTDLDDPDSFFLSDFSITNKPLPILFSAVREVIREDLAPDELLCFEVHELDLDIDEASCEQWITLGSILNLRDELFKNDGIESTEFLDPLRLSLATKLDSSSKLSSLISGAVNGQGLSELVPQWIGQSEDARGDAENLQESGTDGVDGHIDPGDPDHSQEFSQEAELLEMGFEPKDGVLEESEHLQDGENSYEEADEHIEQQISDNTVQGSPSTTNEEDDLIDYSEDEETDFKKPQQPLEKQEPAESKPDTASIPAELDQSEDDDFGLDLGGEDADNGSVGVNLTEDTPGVTQAPIHQNDTNGAELDPGALEDEINFDDTEEQAASDAVRADSAGTEQTIGNDEIDYDDDEVAFESPKIIAPGKRARSDERFDDVTDQQNEAKRPKS